MPRFCIFPMNFWLVKEGSHEFIEARLEWNGAAVAFLADLSPAGSILASVFNSHHVKTINIERKVIRMMIFFIPVYLDHFKFRLSLFVNTQLKLILFSSQRLVSKLHKTSRVMVLMYFVS